MKKQFLYFKPYCPIHLGLYVLLFIVSVSSLYLYQASITSAVGDFVTTQGNFSRQDINSPIIIVYATVEQLPKLSLALTKLSSRHPYARLAIVNYNGLEKERFKEFSKKYPEFYFMNQFDGSKFAVMPFSKTPAYFWLEQTSLAVGPFYSSKKMHEFLTRN